VFEKRGRDSVRALTATEAMAYNVSERLTFKLLPPVIMFSVAASSDRPNKHSASAPEQIRKIIGFIKFVYTICFL